MKSTLLTKGLIWIFTVSGFACFLLGIFIKEDIFSLLKWNAIIGEILELAGMAIFSVFWVSILYEKYIAEHHFEKFINQLKNELTKLDSIQSKCNSLGIKELFESGVEYRQKHPFDNIVDNSEGEIICVGITLSYVLYFKDTIKQGLKKGLNFTFVCIDQETIKNNCMVYKNYKSITSFKDPDVNGSISRIQDIIDWAETQEEQLSGSIKLKCHNIMLYDSCLIYRDKNNGEKIVWNLNFGGDLSEKIFL